jgi:hypothetical protein
MAVIECFHRPFPLPGIQPVTFPEGQWTQVLDWSGTTTQTLVFTVTATPASAVIQWRRQGLLPFVKEGSFQGEADFNIYPTDTTLKIQLLVTDPNVEIKLAFQGHLPLPTPPGP